MSDTDSPGLSLAAFRGLRFTASDPELGRALCPPYDVIDARTRAALVAQSPTNAAELILPEVAATGETVLTSTDAHGSADDGRYRQAATTLQRWVDDGVLAVDAVPALYVYEMQTPEATGGSVTRGLLGALELRDPLDGVILPHENTMAGPVADRLALMDATDANLEPIYLVYDGGGAASSAVAAVTDESGLAVATTPDGVVHRLWTITDQAALDAIERDLAGRRALIADGHHRYATYRQLAELRHDTAGPGPWDRGLALLVDSSTYGPQVHSIHRVIASLTFDEATAAASGPFAVSEVDGVDEALRLLAADVGSGFMVAVSDGLKTAIISDPKQELLDSARAAEEPAALLELDITVLHRVLISRVWGLDDHENVVGYAHSVDEAMEAALLADGIAVLVRPTPIAAVAAVAAAGARMPRKSTFFTPKPASGLVMRRFADE